MVRLATDGPASASQRLVRWAPSRPPADAKMGLAPIYQRPKTSEPHPQHRIYGRICFAI